MGASGSRTWGGRHGNIGSSSRFPGLHPRAESSSKVIATFDHMFRNADRTATFCIYDGPSPEAIRMAAQTNGLPVDRITEVSVLDPYFYH